MGHGVSSIHFPPSKLIDIILIVVAIRSSRNPFAALSFPENENALINVSGWLLPDV